MSFAPRHQWSGGNGQHGVLTQALADYERPRRRFALSYDELDRDGYKSS
jgi:hypothetical protein